MSRERITELRKQMADIHAGYVKLKTEVDDLVEVERRAASHAKWADYKFKVGMYGGKLYAEDQIQEVSDRDREEAKLGDAGIAITNSEMRDGYSALLMKDKSEYARFALILKRITAAVNITEGKDKERNIKILLGEEVEEEAK